MQDGQGKQLKRRKREKKPIPWVKILRFKSLKHDYKIAVDAFNYAPHEEIEYYFLSHFHSDHYGGMTQKWNNGKIFCSEVTASLVALRYKLSHILLPLKTGETHEIIDDLFVTLIDANHCPGASIILYEFIQGTPPDFVKRVEGGNRNFIRACENNGTKIFRILHTGDFRVCSKMIRHPLLYNHKIDKLYLDTTYMCPLYSFPEQEDVVKQCGNFGYEICTGLFYNRISSESTFQQRITDFVVEEVSSFFGAKRPAEKFRILLCIGTYTIGKEKIALELAKRLNVKIYADHKKREILKTYDSKFMNYDNLITDDPLSTPIHLISMMNLKSVATLEKYFEPLRHHFKNIIGLRPTGWTLRGTPSFTTKELNTLTKKEIITKSIFNRMKFDVESIAKQFKTNKVIQVYQVPYSEHSSFRELCIFIILLDIAEIIPTVNISSPQRIKEMNTWFAECQSLKKERHYSLEDFWDVY